MAKAGKIAAKKAQAKSVNGGSEAADAMDEREPTEAPATSPPVAAASPAPQMKILGQYLKDLSFENPNAPQSLNTQANQPEISISVNVNARTISPTDFEVELHLDAKASHNDKVVFAAELLYAGDFHRLCSILSTLPPCIRSGWRRASRRSSPKASGVDPPEGRGAKRVDHLFVIGNFLKSKPRRQGVGTRREQPWHGSGSGLPVARDTSESEGRLLAADEFYVDFRQ